MRSRDEVLREFDWGGAPYTRTKDPFMTSAIEDMADRIRELEAQVATVDAEREQAFQVAQQNEQTARRLSERVRELEVASAAGVTVTEAMVERFSLAYRICEETHERTFTHNMGIKAGLTAALTRPTTPTRGSDE